MRSTVHAAILANTYDIAGALNGPCASRACAHQSQEPAHASSAQSTNQRYVVRLMRQRSVVCSTVGGGGWGAASPRNQSGRPAARGFTQWRLQAGRIEATNF